MSQDVEILKFELTEDLKFFGIATVRLFRSVVLRYKVVENKDGSGFFVVPPSYKREFQDGTDKWTPWFMLDSMVFNEEVQDMIREYVNRWITANSRGQNQQPQQGSVNQNNPQAYQATQDEQLPF